MEFGLRPIGRELCSTQKFVPNDLGATVQKAVGFAKLGLGKEGPGRTRQPAYGGSQLPNGQLSSKFEPQGMSVQLALGGRIPPTVQSALALLQTGLWPAQRLVPTLVGRSFERDLVGACPVDCTQLTNLAQFGTKRAKRGLGLGPLAQLWVPTMVLLS